MCGIGPQHIRDLCENPLNGGFGMDPSRVGALTIDQIYLLTCDRKMLRRGSKARIVTMGATEAAPAVGGVMKGRAADGTQIVAEVGGKSLAQRIRERKAKEREEAEQQRLKAERREARRKRRGR